LGQVVVRDIEKTIHFQFGHHERMAFPQGEDIQEGEKSLVLRNLIGGYLSVYDLENSVTL